MYYSTTSIGRTMEPYTDLIQDGAMPSSILKKAGLC